MTPRTKQILHDLWIAFIGMGLGYCLTRVTEAHAGPVSPCYWSGTVAKCLPSTGIELDNQKTLAFDELTSNGTMSASFKAPASLAASYTITWPPDDGAANQFLRTDGSGVTSWTAVTLTTDVTGVLPLANGGTAVNASGITYPTTATTDGDFVMKGAVTQTVAGSKTFSSQLADSLTTDATTTTSGGLTTLGGISSAKQIFVGTSIDFSDHTKGVKGTATNNDAGAGFVGQRIFDTQPSLEITNVTSASAFDCDSTASVAAGTTTGATGITLSAGDWELSGNICYSITTAALTSLSLVSGWYGTNTGNSAANRNSGETYSALATIFIVTNGSEHCIVLPTYRVSTAATPTYYLKGQGVYVVAPGKLFCEGRIAARRMR